MDLRKTKVFPEKRPIFHRWHTSSPMPFDRELNSKSNTTDSSLNTIRWATCGWKYSMDFGKTKVIREKPPIFHRWSTSSLMPFDRESNSESNTSDSRLNTSRWANRRCKYYIDLRKIKTFREKPPIFHPWPTSTPIPFDRELNSQPNTSDSSLNKNRWANRGWKYSMDYKKTKVFLENPHFSPMTYLHSDTIQKRIKFWIWHKRFHPQHKSLSESRLKILHVPRENQGISGETPNFSPMTYTYLESNAIR